MNSAGKRPEVVRIALSFAALLILCAGCSDKSKSDDKTTASSKGISKSDLARSSPSLYGWWVQHNSVLPDDRAAWYGSVVAYKRDGDKLYLCTCSHCLDLPHIAEVTWAGNVEVADYGIRITFLSGAQRNVLRMAETTRALDLALLEVDASGLEEGRDYILLSYDPSLGMDILDDAVAVGNPKELSGTVTEGKISQFRRVGDVLEIQTDTAINHGNSGGPLFLKKGDRYHWIGVNDSKFDDSQGLGFAISAGEINKGSSD